MLAADYASIAAEATSQIGLALAGGVTIYGLILGVRTGLRMFKSFTRG